jgi:hypothetical protein
MGKPVLVEADGTQFYVEVQAAPGGEADLEALSLEAPFSFDDVGKAIQAIGATLTRAWQSAKPDEAQVEFGLEVTAKAGKLTSMIVEGGGTATLKVTLTWKGAAPA